jgi:hypothetical protein
MIYCYHFTWKSIYSYTYFIAAMAGVLERLKRPWQKRPRAEHRVFPSYRLDLQALELETAKEILCEVFGVVPGDVEEMIRQRIAEQEAS